MILWERQTLRNGQWYYVKIGPLAGWILRDDKRYTCGFHSVGEDEYSRDCLFVETALVPEKVNFFRIFTEKSGDAVLFRPALPDRPVVVNLGGPVKLHPGSEMEIYVSLPLWLQGAAEGNRLLFDVPTTVLPDTWFGSPTSGSLGYALNGSFFWKKEDVFPFPNAIVCPLRIRNASRGEYLPSRAVLPAANLPVYLKTLNRSEEEGSDSLLITPEAIVEYKGNDELDLEVSDRLPPYLAGSKLLMEPRSPGENMLEKGLFLLKKISNI